MEELEEQTVDAGPRIHRGLVSRESAVELDALMADETAEVWGANFGELGSLCMKARMHDDWTPR